MSEPRQSIFFVGGGTGGHIFPNLAILERLRERGWRGGARFLISSRPVDAHIVHEARVDASALSAAPLSVRPLGLVRFARGYVRSRLEVRALIRSERPAAVIATGGFVTGPAVVEARRAGVGAALLNLDAVPGKANRLAARHADLLLSSYPVSGWTEARTVGLPLRREVVREDLSPAQARLWLGLEADRPTLLVTAGSQGARSINAMMCAACEDEPMRTVLAGWQIHHLSGREQREEVAGAYERAGVCARVESFSSQMGLAWRAASAAISRAGAGSVAEARANRVPTLFLPYPFHKDKHQRENARPMVEAGGAVLMHDQVEAARNLAGLRERLLPLLADEAQRETMSARLAESRPTEAADVLAAWLAERGVPVEPAGG